MTPFYQTFREKLNVFKIFCKTEKEGMVPNSVYKASIALLSKPNDTKLKKNILSLMNIHAKIRSKTW